MGINASYVFTVYLPTLFESKRLTQYSLLA
jgi:hypothetical protein